MRYCLGAFLAMVFLSAAVADEPKKPDDKKPPEGWQEFTNKEGNFACFMPAGKVTESQNKAKDGSVTNQFLIKDDTTGGTYSVAIIDFAEVVKQLGSGILEAMKGDNKDETAKKITLDGHPGYALEGTLDKNKEYKKYTRLYYVAGRVYMVLCVVPDKAEGAKNSKVFMESFHLSKPVAVEVPNKEWKEFTSKEGRFTVTMPASVSKPETKKDDSAPFAGIDATGQVALVPDTKQAYMLVYADLPAKDLEKGADAVFAKLKDDFLKQKVGDKNPPKVASEKKLKQGEFAGMQYVLDGMDDKGKPQQMTFQVYLAKNRCYCLTASAFEGPFDEKEAKKFFESFKIADSPQQ
jgi:hypothetical protein